MTRFHRNVALPTAICAALALAVAIGLGRFGFSAAYPLMIRDGVVSLRGGSLAQAVHFLGYFAGAAAIVWLPRDRIAYACALGVAVSVALLAVTAFAAGMPEICAVRFLSGIASGVVMATASTWLFGIVGTAWAPILYGGAGLGIVAAGESVAWLPGRDASGRSAWLVLAATGVVLALPPLLALARPQKARANPATPPPRPDIGPLRLVLVYAAAGFGYVICATYLPLLVARATFGLNPIHVFSFFGLCAAPSCLVWIRLDATLGTRRTLAANFALQAAGTSMPMISSHPVVLLAAAALVGGTFMGVVALAMSAGRRHGSELGYNLMAVLTAAYALGQAVGPGLCALVAHGGGGLDRALAAAAGVLGLASAAAFLARGRNAREAEPTTRPYRPSFVTLRRRAHFICNTRARNIRI